MIYRDYLKDKNQNSIKFKEVEGNSPLAFSHSKGRDLKNYQIYGNSTQKTTGKNILPYPFVHTTRTIYGITFTDNKDGTITLNGTSTFSTTTSIADFYLCRNISISAGTYTLSGCPSGGSTYKYRLMLSIKKSGGTSAYYNDVGQGCSFTVDTDTTVTLTIRIGGEIGTVSNLVFKPQLELGLTATEYEAYHMSPSPDFPSEVESVGELTTKNLFDAQSAVLTNVALNDDGTITTLSNSGKIDIYLKAGTYTIKINCDFSDNIFLREGQVDYGYIKMLKNGTVGSFTLTSDNYLRITSFVTNGTYNSIMLVEGSYTSDTMPSYEPYHKYDIPVTVRGKNLLPNSDWMSGAHQNGFQEQVTKEYITEYTQNSISFNLLAWTGVSSPRFLKDRVKRIVFKINQNAISSDGYTNFYIIIQGYDNDNNKTGNQIIYNNAVADTEYVFDISAMSMYSWYANSTQFSFCILARKNALSNLMVYDIAYYADTDTTSYEPYKGKATTHIYLDEPLRKVGDYADYIDFKNQKVVRNILKQSLNANDIYKKLNNVIRIGGINTRIKQKYDAHILSTIFNYYMHWTLDSEIIFHHGSNYYSYYWSVYWSRLGLTYDGTNVYRTDDTEQTPLTDSEIIGIANEWLDTLSDENKKVFMILDTPTEESITIPNLTLPKSEKATMMVNTSVKPSNIYAKYIRM